MALAVDCAAWRSNSAAEIFSHAPPLAAAEVPVEEVVEELVFIVMCVVYVYGIHRGSPNT
jgi:hypothetical protein